MGLKEIAAIPDDAVHDPDQDQELPNGATVEHWNADGAVYVKVEKDGDAREYVLTPDAS